MSRLLVIHHSPTATMRALTESVLAGASDDALEGVEVVAREALEATAADALGADGILLGTPANFGYMAGALKHFFDSSFLELGGALADDGSGAPAEGAGSRSVSTSTVATTPRGPSARSSRSRARCPGAGPRRCCRCWAT